MNLSNTPQKYIPAALSADLVRRLRLESVLMKGLENKARLVTVIAPAGYGKSTLVSSWITENKIPAIWINLDPTDNDPDKFLSSTQQAFDVLLANSAKTPNQPNKLEITVQTILERFRKLKKSTILVFDNLESIDNTETQNLLFSLITQLPINISAIVLSRKNLSLPISRMRAHNQLVEIGESNLQFNSKEIHQFLKNYNLNEIDSRNLEILTQKTRSWPAGLRLALEILGDQLEKKKSLAVKNLNGSHPYFSDYFNEEIFSGLDEGTKDFLQKICVFDQFSARLCHDIFSITNSDEKIEHLIESQLFIYSSDSQPGWYSLHPLFQDFLLNKIKAKIRNDSYQKAANWFYQQEKIALAVDYAFRSGDEETVLKIIEPACESMLLDGDIRTITGWINKWRSRGFSKRSELLIFQGWLEALQGDFVKAQMHADQAKDTLVQQGKTKDKNILQKAQITKGKLATLQSFIEVMYTHRYDIAGKQAKEALKLLPRNHSAWILMARWSQAETQKRIEHINKAIETMYKAMRIGNSLSGKVFQFALVNAQAAALHFSGRRKEALAVCRKAISRSHNPDDPLLGAIYAWIARLHNEANQMDKAIENIEKGIHLSKQAGVSLNLIFSHYYASQIYQAAGQGEKALQEIHHAQQLVGNAALSDESWLNAWETNLNLVQGNEIQVEHWIRREGRALDQKPDYLNIESLIVYARYLIRKDNLNPAFKKLQAIEKLTEKRGYNRWLLTTYLLQAIIWERRNKRPQALACVKRALFIAAPEEYQRAFLDEDKIILNLVQDLSTESPAFVMRLLRSASLQKNENSSIPASILPKPLSKREIQVLKLLVDGKKGPQIAKDLFISYSTVRTHLKSIHRKLDVHNRQELLEKIRLLELV